MEFWTERLRAPPRVGLLPTPHPSKLLYSDIVKTPPRPQRTIYRQHQQQPSTGQDHHHRQQLQLQRQYPPVTTTNSRQNPGQHSSHRQQQLPQQQRTTPPQSNRSSNPAFVDMVRGINSTARLLFGYDNWQAQFPWRLSQALQNFTESIHPPHRAATTGNRLNETTKIYKKKIQQIVINELCISAIQQLEHLHTIQASSADWQLAAETAMRQLRRSHKHIIPALLQPLIKKIVNYSQETDTQARTLKRYFPQLLSQQQHSSNGSDTTESSEYIVLSSTANEPTSPVQTTSPSADNSSSNNDEANTGVINQAPSTVDLTTLSDIILHSPDLNDDQSTADTEADNGNTNSTTHSTPAAARSPANSTLIGQQETASATTTTTTAPLTTQHPLPQRTKLPVASGKRSLQTTPVNTPTDNTQSVTNGTSRHRPTTRTSATAAAAAAATNTTTVVSAAAGTTTPSQQPSTSSLSTTDDTSSNIRPFYYSQRLHWRIKSESERFTTLVIADSNGKRWTDAPRHWVIYSFSGMSLGDVTDIMSASMAEIKKYQKIIIHCGRNDSFRSIAANYDNFATFISSITHPPITIVPSLIDPRHQEPGLIQLRQMIAEGFENDAILYDEPQHYVRWRPADLKHYHNSTAKHLIDAIIRDLN